MEGILRCKLDLAGESHGIEDRKSALHLFFEFVIYGLIYRYDIFFIVAAFGAKEPVNDIAVVRKEDQACRVLIETPDREDPFRIADVIDDVVFIPFICRAGDPQRLMESQIDMVVGRKDDLAVDTDDLPGEYLRAGDCGDAVDRDGARFDIFVGFPSGTETAGTDVLIDANRCAFFW